jgi:dTDP-D-glucose 4,6-dehydratase
VTLLVTGGAGFIGSNFVLDWIERFDEPLVNLDALTYAGNLENLASVRSDSRHRFVHGDICDRPLLDRLLAEHNPRAVVHFAADRPPSCAPTSTARFSCWKQRGNTGRRWRAATGSSSASCT